MIGRFLYSNLGTGISRAGGVLIVSLLILGGGAHRGLSCELKGKRFVATAKESYGDRYGLLGRIWATPELAIEDNLALARESLKEELSDCGYHPVGDFEEKPGRVSSRVFLGQRVYTASGGSVSLVGLSPAGDGRDGAFENEVGKLLSADQAEDLREVFAERTGEKIPDPVMEDFSRNYPKSLILLSMRTDLANPDLKGGCGRSESVERKIIQMRKGDLMTIDQMNDGLSELEEELCEVGCLDFLKVCSISNGGMSLAEIEEEMFRVKGQVIENSVGDNPDYAALITNLNQSVILLREGGDQSPKLRALAPFYKRILGIVILSWEDVASGIESLEGDP